MSKWCKIACESTELCLDYTLMCGQSFRWVQNKDKSWVSVLGSKLWNLKQDEHTLYFRVIGTTYTECEDDIASIKNKSVDNKSILKDYFQLDVNLIKLYSHWSSHDKHFAKTCKNFGGIRILRQDPTECLFSFICSSNNHISRITGMIDKLCKTFGDQINFDGTTFYTFPTLEKLSEQENEVKLRSLGFGYRAKYIQQSARMVFDKGGKEWLNSLREKSYEDAHSELIKLPGVGGKVADCVCLMSLDKTHIVPVDTHVKQIAEKIYGLKILSKSLTPASSKHIADHFVKLWGPYAGWAHSVMFTADLKQFKKKTAKKRKNSDENG